MPAPSEKSPDAFRTISEVAASMELPQHVLRFWETRFPQIRPLKRGGGRRYYRPDDVELLRTIRRLLYDQGYTIKGVQKMLREQGAQSMIRGEMGQGGEAPFEPAPSPGFPALGPPPRREPTPSAPSDELSPAAGPPRLSEADAALLRSALADLREAERRLRQGRAG